MLPISGGVFEIGPVSGCVSETVPQIGLQTSESNGQECLSIFVSALMFFVFSYVWYFMICL